MKIYKQGKEEGKIFMCDRCGCVFGIDILSVEDVLSFTQSKDNYGYEPANSSNCKRLSTTIHAVCPKCGKLLDDITDVMKKHEEE